MLLKLLGRYFIVPIIAIYMVPITCILFWDIGIIKEFIAYWKSGESFGMFD